MSMDLNQENSFIKHVQRLELLLVCKPEQSTLHNQTNDSEARKDHFIAVSMPTVTTVLSLE